MDRNGNNVLTRFKFTGRGAGFLWLVLWTGFLTVITAGFFFPFAMTARLRWIINNTYVGEKQLCFKGTGFGFWWKMLVITFLTVITLGIYKPWGYCKIKRWQLRNTDFTVSEDKSEFEFRGTGAGYFWLYLWTGFLNICTAGLLYPFFLAKRLQWLFENIYINNKQLVFKGTGFGILGQWFVMMVFSILTGFFYIPFAVCRMNKWIAGNTYYMNETEHVFPIATDEKENPVISVPTENHSRDAINPAGVMPDMSAPHFKVVSIGRSPESDIRLNDKTVSRNHARILIREGNMIIEDNNSTNGTFVNGVKTTKAVIGLSDNIQVGDCNLNLNNLKDILK